jgi:hypothetical protein
MTLIASSMRQIKPVFMTLQVELLAGPVHAPACSYAVAGSTLGGATVAAGAPLQLAITARDAYGNLAALPAGSLQAAATGPQGTVHFEVEVRASALCCSGPTSRVPECVQ